MPPAGADATASFRLLRDAPPGQLPDFRGGPGPVGPEAAAAGPSDLRSGLVRMLLKRSMLRDHLLSHYMAALERVVAQAGTHHPNPLYTS